MAKTSSPQAAIFDHLYLSMLRLNLNLAIVVFIIRICWIVMNEKVRKNRSFDLTLSQSQLITDINCCRRRYEVAVFKIMQERQGCRERTGQADSVRHGIQLRITSVRLSIFCGTGN